jgi:hypothetical protein
MPDAIAALTEDQRREIFAALVAAQDNGAAVAQSRADVAAQFGVTPEGVARIEREGMDNEWPPL